MKTGHPESGEISDKKKIPSHVNDHMNTVLITKNSDCLKMVIKENATFG